MDSSMEQEKSARKGNEPHALLLPYPSQGHFNPMLQFGKRLAHHGLRVTLAATRYHLRTTTRLASCSVGIEPISDGCDHGGFDEAGDIPTYLSRLHSVGSQTLEHLISAQQPPVAVLVYDSFLPWALDVGKRLGIACVTFFTQSCAVDAIYGHQWKGNISIPLRVEPLPGITPQLQLSDLPPFVSNPVAREKYPDYMMLLMNQFSNLKQADMILVNSFYELEPQETEWMKSEWNAVTIGPTVPSKFLDRCLPDDTHYGFSLWNPNTHSCLQWLDTKPPTSVVYVSFGSMVSLEPEYMEQLAQGLVSCGKSFLWVVREPDIGKLPEIVRALDPETGLVVTWSPQLEVLGHTAVACFMTHCGWNSTLEALCLGVPMVGLPQWTDQPTNGKYVEDVWGVGVRARVDEKGVVGREEMTRCIGEVVDGESGEMFRKNASRWKEAAVKAVSEGGSSYNNIRTFIDRFSM